MPTRLLPLIAGLLPVAAVHLSYWLAYVAGKVPGCMPYLYGCTSISATGRYPPASYLFKAALLPESVLLVLCWLLAARWLQTLERSAGLPVRSGRAMMACGATGAICLVLYVSFLGTHEPIYELMRRFGVYFYFLLTVIAEVLVSLRYRRVAKQLGDRHLRHLANWQLAIVALPFALGIVNLACKAIMQDPGTVENAIEWTFSLLMQSWFVLAFAAWRHTDFQLIARVRTC